MGTHTHAYTYIGHTVPAVHLSALEEQCLSKRMECGDKDQLRSSKTGPPNYFLPKPFPTSSPQY